MNNRILKALAVLAGFSLVLFVGAMLGGGIVYALTQFGDVLELDMWLDVPTQVSPTTLPCVFALQQNYPNPFNAGTTIAYQLPSEEAVSLSIYDLSGQMIRQLVQEVQEEGAHSVHWDGRDDARIRVASGYYLYRLQAGGFHQTRKLLLLK